MTPAPAATETVPKAEDWTAFGTTLRESRPRQLVNEIRTTAGVCRYGGGTVTIHDWVPTVAHVLAFEPMNALMLDEYHAFDLIGHTPRGGVLICEIKVAPTPTDVEHGTGGEDDLSESAAVAREVRDLSGLGARRLGEIFPVERESYQRWVSGRITPSAENLERLLALRHFMRELANRVPSPKSWLLSPIVEGAESPTPYELMKAGNLVDAWAAIADLPSKARRYTREAADGSTLTVTEGSVRGRDLRTSEDEIGDYSDWLGDDDE